MSRNRFKKQKRDLSALRELLLPAALFVLVVGLFVPALSSVSRTARQAERDSLEAAIRRSAAHCYATEGAYPESLDYLCSHYGLQIDEERYLVDYQVFASNLMPSVTVIARGDL